MTLISDTIIQECNDPVNAIPETKYDFISIDKLACMETGTFVGKTYQLRRSNLCLFK